MAPEVEIIELSPTTNLRIALTTRAPTAGLETAGLESKGLEKDRYGKCNLATHVGDRLDRVVANRQWLRRRLQLQVNPVWLDQTHSSDVAEIGADYDLSPELTLQQTALCADASYTRLASTPLAILTADCVPIVLWSQFELAVVHAGWKGLASGIIHNTLRRFEGQVSAWIGPAIGPCHYEVDDAVKSHFKNLDAFSDSRKGHYRFDLQSEAHNQLKENGVGEVSRFSVCTACDARFYSYRRDGDTGRFATIAWRLA